TQLLFHLHLNRSIPEFSHRANIPIRSSHKLRRSMDHTRHTELRLCKLFPGSPCSAEIFRLPAVLGKQDALASCKVLCRWTSLNNQHVLLHIGTAFYRLYPYEAATNISERHRAISPNMPRL